MKTLLIALFMLPFCAFAGSMDDFESAVRAKSDSVKTSLDDATATFMTSVGSKMTGWDSKAASMLNNFKSSINGKFSQFESNFGNSVSTVDKQVQDDLANHNSWSSDLSRLKDSTTSGVQNLASGIRDSAKQTKDAIKADCTADQLALIQDDMDTWDSAMSDGYSDLNESVEDGGDISNAYDDLESAIDLASQPTVYRYWQPDNWEPSWYMLVIPEGTWIVGGAQNKYDPRFFTVDGASAGTGCFGSGYAYNGSAFVVPHGQVFHLRDMLNYGSDRHLQCYVYSASIPDPGGVGYNGTDPNSGGGGGSGGGDSGGDDSNSDSPSNNPDDGKSQQYKSGIDALDKILAKILPDFSLLRQAAKGDLAMSVSIDSFGLPITYSFGGFATAFNGQIAWLQSAVRLISIVAFTVMFFFGIVRALRQW